LKDETGLSLTTIPSMQKWSSQKKTNLFFHIHFRVGQKHDVHPTQLKGQRKGGSDFCDFKDEFCTVI